jgi:hypothetical protein
MSAKQVGMARWSLEQDHWNMISCWCVAAQNVDRWVVSKE